MVTFFDVFSIRGFLDNRTYIVMRYKHSLLSPDVIKSDGTTVFQFKNVGREGEQEKSKIS